jgi:hypothetical protein
VEDTVVRTLWDELAWQLGGKEGYAMVRSADEKAVSPGDSLRLLFNKYSPCLILIDEWVAYARQLHNKSDLPAGDFAPRRVDKRCSILRPATPMTMRSMRSLQSPIGSFQQLY